MPSFVHDVCPVCTSNSFKVIGPSDLGNAKIEKEKTNVVKCYKCKCYYVNPMPHWFKEDFDILYGSSYFGGEDEDSIYDSYFKKIRQQNVVFRFNKIKKYISSSENMMLEVGSGIQAYMAKYLSEIRWGQVTAQEPSPEISKILKNKSPNINVTTEDFLKMSHDHFNLIYADSVFEHTPNPASYFEHASKLLVSGGVLYFVVPNEHSFFNFVVTLVNKLRGKGVVKYLCPYTDSYHLIGFSKKSIEMMANSNGLKLVMHLKSRDHSWGLTTRLKYPVIIKFPIALILAIADYLGFGRNQEFILIKQ